MKNFLKNGGLVLAGSIAAIGTANAALPAGATTAFDTLSADAMDLIDLAWEVAIPVSIAFIVLRLFKKAAGSAT